MNTTARAKKLKMDLFKIKRVKDNCLLPKNDFSAVQSVVDKISDKTLAELEREGVFVFPEKSTTHPI